MSAALLVRIAARDIPPREGRMLMVDGREIAVFNLGHRFLAVDNRCPHKSGPLSDGIVAGDAVVCPLHAWKINLETGQVERPAGEAACVQAYAVDMDGDELVLEVPANRINGSSTASACASEEPAAELRLG